jgi:hypothetical protein
LDFTKLATIAGVPVEQIPEPLQSMLREALVTLGLGHPLTSQLLDTFLEGEYRRRVTNW